MSLFVTVTFDLHGKSSRKSAYDNVKIGFAKFGLTKQAILKKTGKRVKLPANTYVGVYDRKWNHKKPPQLRDYLKNEIQKVMKTHNYKYTIFIAVGNNWAWSKKKAARANSSP